MGKHNTLFEEFCGPFTESNISRLFSPPAEMKNENEILDFNLTEYKIRICQELLEPLNQKSSNQFRFNPTKWIYPFLLFFGLIGNSISFTVMIRVYQRNTIFKKFSVCLAILSIADLNVMFFGCAREYLEEVGIEIRSSSTFACKFIFFICYLFSSFSAFLHAFIAVERWLAVVKPFRSKYYLTSKLNKILIVILFIFCFVFNLPFLCYTTISETLVLDKTSVIGANVIKDCQLSETTYELEIILIDTVFFSLFPFMITSIFSFLTLFKLIRTKAFSASEYKKEEETSQASGINLHHSYVCLFKREPDNKKQSKTSLKYTLMLMSIPISYLITLFPINAIIFQGWLIKLKDTENLYENFGIAYSIGKTLMYLNSSTNFIFYILLGNHLRRDFLAIIPFKKCTKMDETRRTVLNIGMEMI